jgi:uncharacterized protein (DUF169 family)
MARFNESVEKIVQTLELQNVPIGVRFSETLDRQGVERQLRICEALDVVKRENVVINLSKENCTCRGGSYIVGWQALTLEEFAAILLAANIYGSKEVAEASVSKQLKPEYRGRFLVLGPLDKFETDPDMVLFFVNPAQADRILGLACFEGAEPFMLYPASTVCSTISNTLAKGEPDVNLISTFERARHKWSPDKLIVTLPFKDFMIAVRSVDYSGYGKRAAS